MVHRDLKPGNVFLVKMRDETDFVKVLDFGVSKIKAARTKLTRATAVIGTPEYMSPEQATGLIEEIDHRADQWALGCIAWEMLSGYAPFIADDMGALFYQVINMDPHPLARRAPGLPAGVEPVLRRALAKRAGDRFPSIKDFARAFEAAATGRQRELTPAPIEVVPAPVVKGTVAYGEVVVPPPSDWEAKTEAAPPPAMVAEEMVKTSRDGMADGLDELPVWRVKPIYLVGAGVALLLMVLLIALWPRKPTPKPAAVAPIVKPLPAVVPVVKELPAVVPEPPPVLPPSPPPVARVRARPKPARPAVVDERPPGAPKPSPFADPFEPDPPRPKAAVPPREPKPTKARPQRRFIEEL